ncbi:MAG: MBL fold metallo-hydrolase [Deltaproteobacteria bacterium]|nr:MBL fold metallo-hydrolase [Deltaproteobacteria bacterium]
MTPEKNDESRPPSSDEVEISVFGPGFGECIVLHVGENNWIIVDSCIQVDQKVPAALAYLKKIGVNPGDAVRLVIATHWHDDHIRGIGKVLEACNTAQFICSEALNTAEFLTLVRAYGKRIMMQQTTGIDEFNHVLDILGKRAKSATRNDVPKFAIADRILWDKGNSRLGNTSISCRISALSPTDAASLASKLEIVDLLPHEKDSKRRLQALTPNQAAVVLWVNVGGVHVLLGSDLEEISGSNMGWSTIVQSAILPEQKARFFKIPHHGSRTAHCDSVWSDMLEANPIAVLTPFRNGSVTLPTPDDLRRIIALSPNTYVTAAPTLSRSRKRIPAVERTIKEIGGSIRQIQHVMGHVRFRIRPLGIGKIELFGSAAQCMGENFRPKCNR